MLHLVVAVGWFRSRFVFSCVLSFVVVVIAVADVVGYRRLDLHSLSCSEGHGVGKEKLESSTAALQYYGTPESKANEKSTIPILC